MAKETPLAFDDKGRPIYAYNKDGNPVCGAPLKKTKLHPEERICQNPKRMANGRCYRCGGKTPTGEQAGNFKTGEWTRENMTREALLRMVANMKTSEEKRDLLTLCAEKMYEAVESGNVMAALKVFEQLAGSPKTTKEHKIEDTALFEEFGKLLVRHEGEPIDSNLLMEELESALAQRA